MAVRRAPEAPRQPRGTGTAQPNQDRPAPHAAEHDELDEDLSRESELDRTAEAPPERDDVPRPPGLPPTDPPPSSDVPEPPRGPQDDLPAPPQEDLQDSRRRRSVQLTDLSGRTYPKVGAGFPEPPGAGRRQQRHGGAHHARQSRWGRATVRELLEHLGESRQVLGATLPAEPVQVSWPAAQESAGSAYAVPAPPAHFIVAEGELRGRARSLDMALPGVLSKEGPHRPPDDLDRLELARLLALAVDGLHRADVVTAGLDWGSFLFSLEPRPAVVLHEPDRIRRLGGEFLGQQDAGDQEVGTSPFDRDRSRLALLVHRLLVSRDVDAPLDPRARSAIRGLTQDQARRAFLLWERAAGAEGVSPQAREWWFALGGDPVWAAEQGDEAS